MIASRNEHVEIIFRNNFEVESLWQWIRRVPTSHVPLEIKELENSLHRILKEGSKY